MRHGDSKPFRIDKNGTQYFYDWTCRRCGGAGGANQWTYTGWTCYDCGGTGRAAEPKVYKEYTPEYAAKLEAARKARQAKYEAEHAAEIAAAEQARKEREQARQEAEAKRLAEEAARKAKSVYVGSVGDKLSCPVTFDHTAYFDFRDPFGRETRMFVHTFRTQEGSALVWKTTAQSLSDLQEGEALVLTGTVKEHKEYKDEKQTYLIRCKIEKEERA